MSDLSPTHCANPECREPTIKPIHRSSRKVAIDAVDGPPVYSQHITYRCVQCGHTWAVQGYSAEDFSAPARSDDGMAKENRTSSRGW
jgi:hypothetical protein